MQLQILRKHHTRNMHSGCICSCLQLSVPQVQAVTYATSPNPGMNSHDKLVSYIVLWNSLQVFHNSSFHADEELHWNI